MPFRTLPLTGTVQPVYMVSELRSHDATLTKKSPERTIKQSHTE